jgi:hypothetical protein
MSSAWFRQNYDDIVKLWETIQAVRHDLVMPVLDRCEFAHFLNFCTMRSSSEFDNPYLPQSLQENIPTLWELELEYDNEGWYPDHPDHPDGPTGPTHTPNPIPNPCPTISEELPVTLTSPLI